jgi:Polyketide cyclase / dehydrase and lipid transport
MQGSVVSSERIMAAAPEAIFDVVADASRHIEIDGSGQLRGVTPGAPERLALGTTFGMSMHMGMGYTMTNTVIEFEENRRIAWKATVAGVMGRFLGGRIWRYELEPTDDGTRVRESWDISQDHQRFFLRHDKVSGATKDNLEKSLARLDELTAPAA